MHECDFDLLKLSIKTILEHATEFDWTLQGLGMLRLYLSRDVRLHVWDSRFAVPFVSRLHTHPWNFESLVVAGKMVNVKYVQVRDEGPGVERWRTQSIFCGEGGGLEGKASVVRMKIFDKTIYREAASYKQDADEIHDSFPEDGTVTLVRRTFCEDVDHASVFWQNGDWVSAEPRRATADEVRAIAKTSLFAHFGGKTKISRERRACNWIADRIGVQYLNTSERAMRLLEEALELAQAEGITSEQAARQAAHVYQRAPGTPESEARGVAMCLLAWCGATGRDYVELAKLELARNEARPAEDIRGSLKRKADADLVRAEE